MSIIKETEIICPNCETRFECRTYDSINTNKKGALEDIISGNLFKCTCPGCGETYTLVYPILFNDMINHVMIHFLPEKEDLEKVDLDFVKATIGLNYKAYRIVHNINDLSEKALIFNCGLDDRTIELVKVIALQNIQDSFPDETISHQRFILNSDGKPVIRFFDNNNRSKYDVELSDEQFSLIGKEFGKYYLPDKYSVQVDTDWAIDILNRYSEDIE